MTYVLGEIMTKICFMFAPSDTSSLIIPFMCNSTRRNVFHWLALGTHLLTYWLSYANNTFNDLPLLCTTNLMTTTTTKLYTWQKIDAKGTYQVSCLMVDHSVLVQASFEIVFNTYYFLSNQCALGKKDFSLCLCHAYLYLLQLLYKSLVKYS